MAAVTEEKLSNVDKLCRQSIQKYLDIKGIPYEKQGYYLRLTDHDSLVVDTRITSQKPYELSIGIRKALEEICIIF